jgi:hypothetical protein
MFINKTLECFHRSAGWRWYFFFLPFSVRILAELGPA